MKIDNNISFNAYHFIHLINKDDWAAHIAGNQEQQLAEAEIVLLPTSGSIRNYQ